MLKGIIKMIEANKLQRPPKFKQSKTKIWMRIGILIIFLSIFGWSLYHDILSEIFHLSWVFVILLPFLGVGLWMSRLVPMQVHHAYQVITISFDRLYFGLILFLVILKDITGHFLKISTMSDLIMCIILGLMIGRLSGICFRVNYLKNTEFSRQ
jgi:polyferredoxin